MRRSICLSDPQVARAGQTSTWKFIYSPAINLHEGAKMKFDLLSQDRGIDWEPPSVDLNEGANVIYAYINPDELIEMTEIEVPDSPLPQYEFTLPESVKVGKNVTIVIGALPDCDPKEWQESGNECQLVVQRRRPFNLYVDPKGKGNYEEPEVFTMDIRGNKLHTIKVLTPSYVAKNKRFDITVRFEDEYGNLTNFAPEGTLIDLSYEHLRENLNWKLFVPETGFVILPNLYFNEAGVYRIQLRNMQSKEVFTSPPIKCFQENHRNLFWGLLHGESERVDSSENIENCLRHFRDEKALNFFSSSSFEDQEETPVEVWKLISQNLIDFCEEDRFATMLGFQYQGDSSKEGIRHIIYTKDNKPILRKKDSKYSSLSKIYKSFTGKDFISIPSFTMAKKMHYSFKNFNPEFERVVEIYNAWGSSETTKENGNPFPIEGEVKECAEGAIIQALKQNHRFGFVAGGLDDRGAYGDFLDSDQKQYSPGLTAICCEKYNKESMLDALYQRSCYGTTGERIIVGFHCAGKPMGSELDAASKHGLMVNRHLSGFVAGTAPLKTVEIIRNGEVLHTFKPTSYHTDYYYDDMEKLDEACIEVKGSDPFVFYYLRVTQEDGHMAWSSPIWVDLGKKK